MGAEIDEQIAALDAHIATLTGKDNKKERSAKAKEVSELKAGPQYVDACKIVKGSEPKGTFFVKSTSAPAKDSAPDAKAPFPTPPAELAKEPEKKEDKKPKKALESCGISPAERKELEQLKKDLVARKAQLKEEGLSGGQQNKDAQVVEWVKRMNELKEKQDPGSTQTKKKDPKSKSKAPLSPEEQIEMDKLQGDIEAYRHKLKTEFGYTNKDIKADQDL